MKLHYFSSVHACLSQSRGNLRISITVDLNSNILEFSNDKKTVIYVCIKTEYFTALIYFDYIVAFEGIFTNKMRYVG